MGTRCLIHIHDEGETIATIYRQFDGYPEGMGIDLGIILTRDPTDEELQDDKGPRRRSRRLVNGFTQDDVKKQCFNGMGCLAATVVAGLKKDIGNIYLHKPDTKDVCEEFVYTIAALKNGLPLVTCSTGGGDQLFKGVPSDFYEWAKQGGKLPNLAEAADLLNLHVDVLSEALSDAGLQR